MPVNGMADLSCPFFFSFFFLLLSLDDWCEVDMQFVDALHLSPSLSPSHGHTELFCFDIEAYLRYPLSYSKALMLSLLYLLTAAPVIQLITVLLTIWIS